MKVSSIVGARNMATVANLLDVANVEGVIASWHVLNPNTDVRAVKHYGSVSMHVPPSYTIEAHTAMGELYLDVVIAPFATDEHSAT